MDTQASYIIALKFGIYIDRQRLLQQFKQRLKKDGYRIRCGFVGAPLLCTVLGECQEYKLAYDFLLKEDFPSWLYCVNLGATTIWERWNSVMPDGSISKTGMNSLNHYAYGSVMEFMYAYGGGIRPVTDGFEQAVIAPHPDYRLPKVECTYDSVSGRYVCNTTIRPDGQVEIHVEIPFGCTAEVILPGANRENDMYEAGVYDFTYRPLQDFRAVFTEDSRLEELAGSEQAMGVLFQYVPAYAGMAKSHNPEFMYNTLKEMRSYAFIPCEEEQYQIAVKKLGEILVEE